MYFLSKKESETISNEPLCIITVDNRVSGGENFKIIFQPFKRSVMFSTKSRKKLKTNFWKNVKKKSRKNLKKSEKSRNNLEEIKEKI